MTTMETPPQEPERNVDETKAKHLATGDLDSPAISPSARTAVYVGSLVVNVLALLFFGLAGIFGWLDPEQGDKALALIVGCINLLSTGLAIGYRPTRAGAPA